MVPAWQFGNHQHRKNAKEKESSFDVPYFQERKAHCCLLEMHVLVFMVNLSFTAWCWILPWVFWGGLSFCL